MSGYTHIDQLNFSYKMSTSWSRGEVSTLLVNHLNEVSQAEAGEKNQTENKTSLPLTVKLAQELADIEKDIRKDLEDPRNDEEARKVGLFFLEEMNKIKELLTKAKEETIDIDELTTQVVKNHPNPSVSIAPIRKRKAPDNIEKVLIDSFGKAVKTTLKGYLLPPGAPMEKQAMIDMVANMAQNVSMDLLNGGHVDLVQDLQKGIPGGTKDTLRTLLRTELYTSLLEKDPHLFKNHPPLKLALDSVTRALSNSLPELLQGTITPEALVNHAYKATFPEVRVLAENRHRLP